MEFSELRISNKYATSNEYQNVYHDAVIVHMIST